VLSLGEINIEDPVLKGQTLYSKVTSKDLGIFIENHELHAHDHVTIRSERVEKTRIYAESKRIFVQVLRSKTK
jgi:hypothetical protein